LDFGPFLLLATLEGLVMAAVLALTAVGLSLVFGVMRVVNVAHGEFFMLGAVTAWFAASWMPGPPAVGFLAALVISPLVVGVVAVAADRLVLKRLDYDPEATAPCGCIGSPACSEPDAPRGSTSSGRTRRATTRGGGSPAEGKHGIRCMWRAPVARHPAAPRPVVIALVTRRSAAARYRR
jgi:hypothetical protein